MKSNAFMPLLALSVAGLALLTSSCVTVEQAAPPVARLSLSPSKAGPCEQGRQIYVTTCVKCHSIEPIADHTMEDWTGDILPRMCRKSKLTPEQSSAVLAYVAAAHAAPPMPR